jgi:hypothetical protein
MNGLGDNYVSGCDALGTPGAPLTYSLAMANAAALAWSAGTDPSPSPKAGCMSGSACVQRLSATDCAVWCYTKSVAGHVLKSSGTGCTCPMTTDGTWN